jgi:hypothetical protein
VTTVLVASEFSRTLRQEGPALEDSGTDHNPLSNSVLLGGKGITPGLILGQSDFQTSSEALSPAHLALDPTKIKCMGRPFDCQTGATLNIEALEFESNLYLTMHSVVNTVFSVFSVPLDQHRAPNRTNRKIRNC